MSDFHYINPNNSLRSLGIILISAGLIVLAVPLFLVVETPVSKIILVGGGAFATGIAMISIYSGTLIDFKTKKLKEYQSILWFKSGEWRPLPDIENAELIHHTYLKRNTPNGISPTLSSKITVYKCVLLVKGKKLKVFDYTKEVDAIAALDKIRRGLTIS